MDMIDDLLMAMINQFSLLDFLTWLILFFIASHTYDWPVAL